MKNNKWIYLIVLTLIWGSSFILMKRASIAFKPIHIGALRTLICASFLFSFGHKSLTKIKKKHWKWVMISGIVGSMFPAYFYAYAVSGIGSTIPSILNSLTPFNTLWVSVLFFGISFNPKQLFGIIIGLLGTITLIYQGADLNPNQNYAYAVFPLISSVGYAFNINIIKRYLHDLEPLAITTGNFLVISIPSIVILFFTGFFTEIELSQATQTAFLYLCILGIVCTAIAKILFNNLIQISSTIFTSSVTYTIPIVATLWGFLDGERLNYIQILSGVVILIGVWLVNKNR